MSVKTTFIPTDNRVLIKPITPAEKTPGGIFLPVDRTQASEGLVISVGPDCEASANRVKVGDIVSFGFAVDVANTITIDGISHYIIKENELQGIIIREVIEPTAEELAQQEAVKTEVESLPEYTKRTKIVL